MLNKTYTKAATTIQKEGHQRFYIRALAQLEDHVKSVSDNKDTQKKMNPSTARAFNAMKQKIKKHNKLYEENINGWRENPVNEEDSEAEEAEAIAKLAREKEESSEEERDQDEEAELKSDEEAADTFTMVGKKGKAIDMENLYKALKDLIEARGKKNTDKLALISMLRRLYEGATTNAFQKVRVLLVLIPAQFDYTPPITGFMSTDMWKHALNDINTLLTLLDANRHFSVVDFVEEDLPEVEIEKKAEAKEPTPFQGNIPSYVERLDDEFTKSLQNIDPHTMEYIDRLKDETALYALIIRAQRYQERTRSGDFDAVAPTLMRRLEHLYYKPDQVVRTVEAAVKALPGWKDSGSDDPNTLVTDLCVRLYQSQNDRIRIRTLLCHVYHHALHDRFHQARDMMLMSHMQENINSADIQTQIMYNRTMVQLGLCAFRCGLIRDAQAALQEIQSSNRVKELLAQGFQMQRFSEKTPEQEKLEKQRQLPFHMHINLELLECVYFTCSMLLEIPNMAMNAHDSRRKVISRMFRKMLEYNERQIFNGPPENTRDHIMAASKALSQGEWQQCRDLIYVIKIWDLMPNAAAIKEMLGRKIQEEGLRTYFFAFSRHYDSLGLEQLASMFDLPVSTVYSLVAKMIHNEELHASLDQPTNTVVLHRPGPGAEMSRLEYLAGAFPDKVATFVESNERLLEARSITLGLQQAQTREGVQRDVERFGSNHFVYFCHCGLFVNVQIWF
ncbi:eukaryotic translation initiation factor 3 subunit 8 N-terminus-domain-containing protein [Cladochytrium replicatum]|nr:eukaryotic translation initiation factor 3 subunit 8 N-terminus-domain-containing protein [Cladochytrium replicatum]